MRGPAGGRRASRRAFRAPQHDGIGIEPALPKISELISNHCYEYEYELPFSRRDAPEV